MKLTEDQLAIACLIVIGAWERRPLQTIDVIYLGHDLSITPEDWDRLQQETTAFEIVVKAFKSEEPLS